MRGRERQNHSIQSRPSWEHRAQCGARTHEPWDHDLSRSWTLNRLNYPGAPSSWCLSRAIQTEPSPTEAFISSETEPEEVRSFNLKRRSYIPYISYLKNHTIQIPNVIYGVSKMYSIINKVSRLFWPVLILTKSTSMVKMICFQTQCLFFPLIYENIFL